MSTFTLRPKFVSAHTRALLTVASLIACALLDLIGAVVYLLRLLHLGPFSESASDVTALEGTPDFGALLIALSTLAQSVVYILTVVLFLVWLHRAYANLRAFATKTETTPGWAVGFWFIPFANLVYPYRAVKETWIKSDPAINFSNGFGQGGEGARSTALVGVWWLFWIVSNIAAQVFATLSKEGDLKAPADAASGAGFASETFTFIAALLAAAVVWTIDRMQSEKSRQLGLELWAAPPPPPISFDGSFGNSNL